MAEFHSQLYFKVPKSVDPKLVLSLFSDNSETEFLEAATQLNTEHGLSIATKLIESINGFSDDIQPEGTDKYGSIYCVQYVFSHNAEELIDELLLFYDQLLKPLDLRGYMSGDDDQWEVFYKLEGGNLVKEELEPDESESEEIIKTIYAWWHKGLPKKIYEGLLVSSRDEIPLPKKLAKIITKTKVTVPDEYYWEMMFYSMLPDKGEVPEDDDINSYWNYSWSGSDEEYKQIMFAFRRLRVDFVRYDVAFEKHSGSGKNINYEFSASSNIDSYALTYAAFNALIGSNVKQFVTQHPSFSHHYSCADGSVTKEVRQGEKITSTQIYDAKQILSESE